MLVEIILSRPSPVSAPASLLLFARRYCNGLQNKEGEGEGKSKILNHIRQRTKNADRSGGRDAMCAPLYQERKVGHKPTQSSPNAIVSCIPDYSLQSHDSPLSSLLSRPAQRQSPAAHLISFCPSCLRTGNSHHVAGGETETTFAEHFFFMP